MKKRTYDKAFYQKLWGLMIPIVLQNLMLALVAVADAFMLGGMDQNYMSAVSLATQIQFIQNMFLAAATASLGILGAQYWGKGDRTTLDEIFCMALRLCGLVSAVFFLACVFAGRYLMLIFTNESVLIEYGVSYLRIAGFSYLLTGISQCYLIIMKVSEHAKTTAAVSSATVCINIVLNAVFIYGAFGIPAMGVRGAAGGDSDRKDHRTDRFDAYFLSEGIYPSADEIPVLQKPAAFRRFLQMRNAYPGSRTVLGDRIYFVFFLYGSSGSRCGSSQFRGCRSKRCGLLSERRHFRCNWYHGRK